MYAAAGPWECKTFCLVTLTMGHSGTIPWPKQVQLNTVISIILQTIVSYFIRKIYLLLRTNHVKDMKPYLVADALKDTLNFWLRDQVMIFL